MFVCVCVSSGERRRDFQMGRGVFRLCFFRRDLVAGVQKIRGFLGAADVVLHACCVWAAQVSVQIGLCWVGRVGTWGLWSRRGKRRVGESVAGV